MAALGLTRDEIKAIARHTSSAIDGYLDGADLAYVRRLMPKAIAGLRNAAFSAAPLEIPTVFPDWILSPWRGEARSTNACQPPDALRADGLGRLRRRAASLWRQPRRPAPSALAVRIRRPHRPLPRGPALRPAQPLLLRRLLPAATRARDTCLCSCHKENM